ncbi:MAG: MATE family efflux transporter [Paludibacteraceae bacterium]
MSINREILWLAVPSILANITIPLVGLVDTAIVGHISDASAIGGIAIGTMLFDLLYWNFGFLRVGTSGLTAQAYGREKEKFQVSGFRFQVGRDSEVGGLLYRSLRVAMIGALVCIAIQWLFVKGVLALVPCSAEVAAFAERYFFVRIWAAPATLSLMALKGWFIGMQDTVSPMATDILVNVVNMAASYVLAVYTPLGGVGVAWGTLIAQYAGLTLAMGILWKKYGLTPALMTPSTSPYEGGEKINLPSTADTNLTPSLGREGRGGSSPSLGREGWGGSSSSLSREGRGGSSLFRLNTQLFVRSLCFMVVYVGFTALASKYGDTELAVSAILMKLFMLFSYFVDGFAYAGEALVGKQVGEMAVGQTETEQTVSEKGKNAGKGSLRGLVSALFAWSLGVGGAFTLVYALWGSGCIGLLTDDETVLAAAKPYMGWLIAMPIVSTLAFMWDGVFVGAAAGKEIMIAMIWAAVAFVAGYVLTAPAWGVQAIYVGYFAHLLARVIYLTAKWHPLSRKITVPQPH